MLGQQCHLLTSPHLPPSPTPIVETLQGATPVIVRRANGGRYKTDIGALTGAAGLVQDVFEPSTSKSLKLIPNKNNCQVRKIPDKGAIKVCANPTIGRGNKVVEGSQDVVITLQQRDDSLGYDGQKGPDIKDDPSINYGGTAFRISVKKGKLFLDTRPKQTDSGFNSGS